MAASFLLALTSATLAAFVVPPPARAASPAPAPDQWVSFYVAPDGNDAGPGTEAAPFRTLARGRDAARQLSGPWAGDVVVYLRGGTHFLNETLALDWRDSGRDDHRLVFRNYPGESPVVSGGVLVTGWAVGNDGAWTAPSPVADFRQLYVEGKRATRARGDAWFVKSTDGDGHGVVPGTVDSWKNLQDVEFVYQHVWTLPRVHPLFAKDGFLYMQQPAWSFSRYKPDSRNGPPAWVENALELLDEPGEWYLDRAAGMVHYLPLPGQKPEETQVVAPALETLVELRGNATHKVRDVEFSGISFQHGSWLKPNEFGTNFVEVQANAYRVQAVDRWARELSPGNVVVANATGVRFVNCTFAHLGTTALHLRAGVQDSLVEGCKFFDVSGTGVQLGEIEPTMDPEDPLTVKGVVVRNNYITNACVEYAGGVGIFAGYVRDCRIEHNAVSNLPYTGISVGWGWSAAVTEAGNNSVVHNHVYSVMTFLKDGGGIYTLSTSPGTNVSYNVVHDSGWNGLYPDERTNGTTWSYNVVWDARDDFLDHSMFAEGHWNDVRNNFLEDHPLHDDLWYSERDPLQTWGLRPGDPGFPDEVVAAAGPLPPYDELVPDDEWTWQFEEAGVPNPLFSAGVEFGFLAGSSAYVAGGLTFLFRGRGRRVEGERREEVGA
ncbi:MAG: hypothetical protein Kow0069_05530 [Promethearchaeota archaeon]